MLSPAAPLVIGLADTARPILLIGFVLFLFAVAGLAIVVGQRYAARQQAKALSSDTGVNAGADRGADASFSSDWLAETRAEQASEAPRQSWADAILGPGALHDDMSGVQALPPEVRVQQSTAPDVQPDTPTYERPDYGVPVYDVPLHDVPAPVVPDAVAVAPSEQDLWMGAGAVAGPDTSREVPVFEDDAAEMGAVPEFPAYLHPETSDPAQAPTGAHAAAHAGPYAAFEPDYTAPGYPEPAYEEPAYLRSELPDPTPGRHAAPVPGRHSAAPSTPPPPFLVDNFLDDED